MIDLELLNKMVEDKLVMKQKHPELDLYIYNYSPVVQYDKKWNDITRICRGLILDGEGKVVAKPFPKFHNLDEHPLQDIPDEPFDVYEKYDGSLLIVFYHNDMWRTATRGSFVSDQAVKGSEFLKELSIIKNYPTTGLNSNWTYLFEVIYSENRIVCKYDFEGLVLLGIYDNETCEEIDWREVEKLYHLFPDLRIARRYNGISDYSTLGDMISNDREGYVIRFKNGFRVKVKGDEYKRLHKILTNISSRDIWEYLVDNKPFNEILEKVPDEFYNWVKKTKDDIQFQFDSLKFEYKKIFNKILSISESKKQFALLSKHQKYPQILFAMYDGKNYEKIIWKLIYPSYSKPFKNDN